MTGTQSKINELYRDCEGMKVSLLQLRDQISVLERLYYTVLGELEMLCTVSGLHPEGYP